MLSIYIHVPFCIKKCGYCDFYSVPIARDDVPHKEYLSAVLSQLGRDVEELGLAKRDVATIYFGGGTPSLMPPVFFSELLTEFGKYFKIVDGLEVSCEVNPATADAQWFKDARAAGITRCSIGVQSFQERLLKELGRIHSAEDAMQAIAEAQESGFASVSIDLMYAIADETMQELEDDLRTAMTFQPEHISAYQLTIEKLNEGQVLNLGICQDSRPDPIEENQLGQMRTVARMLTRNGWQRYEISNFAKQGHECRHNLNYWRYGEYLGLGAGATSFVRWYDSTIVQTSKPVTIKQVYNTRTNAEVYHRTIEPSNHRTVFARRWTQIRDVAAYIAEGKTLAESEDIDARTAMAEYCFMGLRTTEGISPQEFEQIFGANFNEIFGGICDSLKKDGLIVVNNGRFTLTQKGVEISNLVFQYFLA